MCLGFHVSFNFSAIATGFVPRPPRPADIFDQASMDRVLKSRNFYTMWANSIEHLQCEKTVLSDFQMSLNRFFTAFKASFMVMFYS